MLCPYNFALGTISIAIAIAMAFTVKSPYPSHAVRAACPLMASR
jgi:hypothetical protein